MSDNGDWANLRYFQRRMRMAGWRRVNGPAPSVYQFRHRNGDVSEVHLLTYHGEGTREAEAHGGPCYEWQRWAAIRQTPPPF